MTGSRAKGFIAQPATFGVSADQSPSALGAEESPLHLGPFVVRAESAEAEAFGRETRNRAGLARVPFTFPVRWLARPEIRAAAAQMMGGHGWIPIHELQSFDYHTPLEHDVDYTMKVQMSREAKPPRLILRAEIATEHDDLRLRMEMTLRIVTMPAPDERAPET